MVTLYGSADETASPFNVHKDFATYHSPTLRSAFNSPFLEGQTQVYRIDGAFDDNVMRMLAHWFYTTKVDLQDIKDAVTGKIRNISDVIKGDDDSIGQLLVQLWILADRLLIPKLKNAVIDQLEEILRVYSAFPGETSCHYAYDHTAVGSPLRAWLVFRYSTCVPTDDFKQDFRTLPREMRNEMTLYLHDKFQTAIEEGWVSEYSFGEFLVPEDREE